MTYQLQAATLPIDIAEGIWGKVQTSSAIARLSPNKPKTTYGPQVQMVWTEKPKAQIVTQGQQKNDGSGSLDAVTADSFKIVVNQRLSDEFVKADSERRGQLYPQLIDGAAQAIEEQIDLAALYGISVLGGSRASVITHFINETTDVATIPAGPDYTKTNSTVWSAASAVMANGYQPNGLAMSNKLIGALGAAADTSGRPLFPDVQMNGTGLTSFAGVPTAVSPNVHGGRVITTDNKRLGFVGDYSALQWGYVNGIQMEVIEYGDPDSLGRDLKAYNEVCIRLEAYAYMLIADIEAFAAIANP